MAIEQPNNVLKSDADFLRALLDSIADPIFVKDEHHRWVYGNPAFWRILGEDGEANFLMKDDSAVFPADEVKAFWDIDDRIVFGGETIENEETITAGIRTITARTMKSPFTLPGGRPGLVGVIRDISREKSAQRDARASRDEAARKSEFLATMSHELRTPLNAILGMAQIAKLQDLPDQHLGLIDTIEDAGKHLLELITNVLDIARDDVDRLDLHEDWFEVDNLFAGMRDTVSGQAKDKGVELDLTVDDAVLPSYFGDEARIRQILHNLLCNGIKFTATGKVSLVASADGTENQLTFTVTDTGRGIDDADLEQIFEPFHRVQPQAGEVIDGVGLGLAIVDRLVRQMDGSIDVKSAPGQGTRFTVTLPLKGRAAGKDTSGTHDPNALSLLCAEDDETNCRVVAALLAPLTRNITFVGDGQRACAAAGEKRFDAILMDVRMPVMSGIEATKQIRKDEKSEGRAPVPIIAVTANTLDTQVQECLEAGMDYHLAKPINGAQLIRLIVNAVDQSTASDVAAQPSAAGQARLAAS